MTSSIASIIDPITKGGHENYKKGKKSSVKERNLMSKNTRMTWERRGKK